VWVDRGRLDSPRGCCRGGFGGEGLVGLYRAEMKGVSYDMKSLVQPRRSEARKWLFCTFLSTISLTDLMEEEVMDLTSSFPSLIIAPSSCCYSI
jgi:hypothetical protein